MRIRATCRNCSKDFYFRQLYLAAPEDEDRCPNCSARLGIVNVRHSTAAADAALAELTAVLQGITQRDPQFSIVRSSVLSPIERVVHRDAPPDAEAPRRRHRRRSAKREVVG